MVTGKCKLKLQRLNKLKFYKKFSQLRKLNLIGITLKEQNKFLDQKHFENGLKLVYDSTQQTKIMPSP